MRESEIERTLCEYATRSGCLTLKLNGPGDRGKPDRWFGYNGQSLFLEIKRPNREPVPLQRWWLKRLRAQGHRAEWCDNVQDGVRIISEFIKSCPQSKPDKVDYFSEV